MGETDEGAALPDFVTWPSFPFEGDLRVRTPPEHAYEPKRAGDPDGPPCRCPEPDSNFIWADAHWRVRGQNRNQFPSCSSKHENTSTSTNSRKHY